MDAARLFVATCICIMASSALQAYHEGAGGAMCRLCMPFAFQPHDLHARCQGLGPLHLCLHA